MKALTIHQPWAWAICGQGKRVENREWQTAHRGLLAIHAGRTYVPGAAIPDPAVGRRLADLEAELEQAGRVIPAARHLQLGRVVAVAYLDGCHQDQPGCPCSSWSVRGQWHWELAEVWPLQDPVPCRGQRGLWEPPHSVAVAVAGQMPMQARALAGPETPHAGGDR